MIPKRLLALLSARSSGRHEPVRSLALATFDRCQPTVSAISNAELAELPPMVEALLRGKPRSPPVHARGHRRHPPLPPRAAWSRSFARCTAGVSGTAWE